MTITEIIKAALSGFLVTQDSYEIDEFEQGAALAVQSALKAAGYAIRPIEPTVKMATAGQNALDGELPDGQRTGVEDIYRAMLAAFKDG